MLDTRQIVDDPADIVAKLATKKCQFDTDAFLALELQRKQLLLRSEELSATRNAESKLIGQLMSAGKTDEAEDKKAAMAAVGDELSVLQSDLAKVDEQVKQLLSVIPNLPADSVPVGADESANVDIRQWGQTPQFDFEPKAHWDIGAELGIIDMERAAKLSGARFSLLKGQGALLERAIIYFMLSTHTARGYTEWWPPLLGTPQTLYGTGQLPKFEEDLFKTVDGSYLIPTAEVMLTNIHAGEILDVSQLPLSYTAFTPCFREEAGSAGKDTRGLIRLHQFDKVELVKYAKPEESWADLEQLTVDAEFILQELELPYRVIELCTGDLGFSAAKTYDIEVWLPSYDGYKEISSCSNCTGFQARRAGIRYKDAANFKGTRFVHTLNGSGLAVGRTMAAILENNQNSDGSVTIPTKLQPYMNGLTKLTVS